MISKFIYLIVIVILLLVVTISNKTKELFYAKSDKSDKIYSKVDPDHPSCLSKCIIESGATTNFCKAAFEWNTEHREQGYCHTANDKEFPFKCSGDDTDNTSCVSKCGDILDYDPESNNKDKPINMNAVNYKGVDESILHIDPLNDYSRCVNTKYGCVEHTLNHLSQGCALYTSGCKQCIENYYPNIKTLWDNVVKDAMDIKENCNAPTEASL